MKRILVLKILLLFILQSSAQDYHIVDSLINLISIQNRPDTNTVNRDILLARQYGFSLPDSAIYYSRKAILLSRQLQFDEGLLTSVLVLPYPLALARSDSAAVSSALSALKIAEDKNDSFYLLRTYFMLGSIYLYIKDYDKSILYNQKVLNSVGTSTSDHGNNLMNGVHQHLADCYLNLHKLDSAMIYLNKIAIHSRLYQEFYGYDFFLLGNAYLLKSDYSTALQNYQAGLDLSIKDNIKKDISSAENEKILTYWASLFLPSSSVLLE